MEYEWRTAPPVLQSSVNLFMVEQGSWFRTWVPKSLRFVLSHTDVCVVDTTVHRPFSPYLFLFSLSKNYWAVVETDGTLFRFGLSEAVASLHWIVTNVAIEKVASTNKQTKQK